MKPPAGATESVRCKTAPESNTDKRYADLDGRQEPQDRLCQRCESRFGTGPRSKCSDADARCDDTYSAKVQTGQKDIDADKAAKNEANLMIMNGVRSCIVRVAAGSTQSKRAPSGAPVSRRQGNGRGPRQEVRLAAHSGFCVQDRGGLATSCPSKGDTSGNHRLRQKTFHIGRKS